MIFVAWLLIMAIVLFGSMIVWANEIDRNVAYITGLILGFGVAIIIGYMFGVLLI